MKNTLRKGAAVRPLGRVLLLLTALLLVLCVTELCCGRYQVSVRDTLRILLSGIIPMEHDWSDMARSAVVLIRLPRMLGAILIGAALALSGCAYQSIFQNPLVSPDLLGVSNGACIGAALAILGSGGAVMVQLGAFLGGMAAVGLTAAIPRLMRKKSTVTLVLSGVIVSGLCGSIMGIIKYVADPESELAEIVYWQMGSLSKLTTKSLPPMVPVIVVCIVGLLILRWRVNVLSLGDREAQALGVNLRLERGVVVVLSTLLTASSVCLAGTISWVGLVMPHLARGLVGTDNTRTLPVAALLSACFMLVVDLCARGLTGAELPVSILTGIIGAPFFAFILAKEASVE